jgi:hypothetical protein
MKNAEINQKFTKFAEYYVKSKKMYINYDVVKKIEISLNIKGVNEILIAHELFHHYEVEELGRINRRYKINVKLLGIINVKYSLLAMSEIAANSFAKNLLNLQFEPKMLESIITKIY